MRRFLLALLLALAACEAPESQLRQVTIESPASLGLSLREVPASALRTLGLGYGLTSGSDRLVAKAIIGYDFPVPGATSHSTDNGPKLPLTMKTPPRQTAGNILNYSASPP